VNSDAEGFELIQIEDVELIFRLKNCIINQDAYVIHAELKHIGEGSEQGVLP